MAAARRGAKVLLLERYGFCGGMATAALVNPMSGHAWHDPLVPESGPRGSLIGGVFKDVIVELKKHGAYGSALSDGAFDQERLKAVYDELLARAGVKVCYHCYVMGVKMDGKRVVGVTVASKEGVMELKARNFVDCTGDGDVAAMAGCGMDMGRKEDGLTQAMTVSFRMANVDKTEMLATGGLRKARALVEPYFQEAIKNGSLHYPYRNFVHFYDFPQRGMLHFNMTRINEVNGLKVADLTRGEMEGRRQAYIMADWLVENVPWFKKAYLSEVACQVGVRETRHLRGLYVMTQEDIVAGRKFADGVVRSRYFIDIHNPKGAVDIHQQEGGKGAVKSGFGPAAGDYYEVPFRSLLSADCVNLAVPCRALSATHEASAAIRVMATMHALGEAAGIGAAMASGEKRDLMDVEGEHVREQLKYMDEPPEIGGIW